jgi:phosphate-selective porin OprO/OprP
MWADVHRDSIYPTFDLRNPGGDLDYQGFYIMASYVLTGETKTYDFDSGTFGAVHPKSRKGAWEILVRHSYVNLADRNLAANPYFTRVDFVPVGAVDDMGFHVDRANNYHSGVTVQDIVGSAHSTAIGLTWWVNDNVRFLANYVRADLPNDNDVDIFGLRAQVTW